MAEREKGRVRSTYEFPTEIHRSTSGRVSSPAGEPYLSAYYARVRAEEAHAGQVDKIGEPYIGHPERVAVAAWEATRDPEVMAAAWLHDVVEDTPVTLDALRAEGFSERVVCAVDALTKRKGEPFADYYERVKADPVALVVKWHDVADNADPRRLAKVAPDTQDRLREKYERAKALLTAPARTPTPDATP